jgi:hypothetical protein
VDVFGDPNRPLTIFCPGSPFAGLKSSVIGASRRSLLEIFGDDVVEHRKVMRFFGDGDMTASRVIK